MNLELIMPTYALNLTDRIDRRQHIINEFKNKNEYRLNVIQVERHKIGSMGIWEGILQIISIARARKETIILFCEDDHTFTDNYDCGVFLDAIDFANTLEADFVSGGIGWVSEAFPVPHNLCWINEFYSMQFTVIFERFFDRILNADFKINDTADNMFGKLTKNKFVFHPFVSTQKYFGYSDVTEYNSTSDDYIPNLFAKTNKKLEIIKKIFTEFNEDLHFSPKAGCETPLL